MTNDAEQEIRALIEERVAAVAAKDPEPLAARQHDDIVVFDVLPPLRSAGRSAVLDKTEAWFDSYSGAIGYEVHELEVSADGDVGFCSFVYHVTGTLESGDEVRHVGSRDVGIPPHRRRLAHRPRPRVGPVRSRDRAGADRPRTLNLAGYRCVSRGQSNERGD